MFVSGNTAPGVSWVGTPLSPVTDAVTAACAAAGAHNVNAAPSATAILHFIEPPESV